jgi:alginate O-acetyltransferase complex protein AlgJ
MTPGSKAGIVQEEVVDDASTQWRLKDDGKVVEGKNGRLFLDNDRNHVVDQHTGKLLFTDQQLATWQRVLESRIAWLAKLGTPYFFVVPPNAHSVYPEDLPEHIASASVRPIHQIIDHLDQVGSVAEVIYPLDEIVRLKPDALLYPLTDPHWSADAAFVAYTSVARRIGEKLRIHQILEKDVTFQHNVFVGELGYKVSPQAQSERLLAQVNTPQAFLVSDNLIFNRGMRIVTECPDAPNLTCLMLGDSFSGQLWNFFAATFRRFVYAHVATLDFELVKQERPDVVVSVLNERFLITIPHDMGAQSLKELEAQKREEQQFRPALKHWPSIGTAASRETASEAIGDQASTSIEATE